MAHHGVFGLHTRGGTCPGEQWLCDGDEPIARLQWSCAEQPEQNLRYFNRNLKPVELRQLRLRPGDRPLIEGVQLYWSLGPVATTELVGVQVSGQDSACLGLEVVTRTPEGVATSRRRLELRYDAAADSYVYGFAAHLEIHSPEVFDGPDGAAAAGAVRFEYCDPWYSDVPGPTVAFPGRWTKRYGRLLAEAADGTVWQMPLNHMATGIPTPEGFAPDGRLVLADDPGHNPALVFLGPTAGRSRIGVCNWGYDVHCLAQYRREELYAPICERFEVRRCPDADAARLLAAAGPVPPVQYRGFAELPRYERRGSFAAGLRLDQPADGSTDPWPWLPSGDGAEWCRDEGRSDRCSLKIARTEPGATEWTMNREGDGAWTEAWTPGTGFRVSVHIRTRRVEGRGACLALRWAVYNAPERYPYVCSERLTGTRDWTRVEVRLQGPPPGISAIAIVLRQDGTGTSWYDDLEVEPCGAA
jgi:hypothetical protein